MPQISILSLLGYSGASTVFFITLGFAALSMTKVSPKSFQLARICFIATGVVPLAALIYAATQYQMANYWRIIVFLVGTTTIAVQIGRAHV